jgi:AcrR family transcriptional regulator/DNA-binding MarR family transcriptional regulator
MPKVLKTKSATQIRNISSRSKSPRKRADREENSRICAVQRVRMLSAAARVVEHHGYDGLTVSRITTGAGVSRRTFYQQFADREDCFLALFETASARAETLAQSAAANHAVWREQIRAGLSALLLFAEAEPALGSLLVVGALNGGPRVLERRARKLEAAAKTIDRGRNNRPRTDDGPPPLTAEGLVGAILGVIHARLLDPDIHDRPANGSTPTDNHSGGLVALLNPLMGMIVLPYLGKAAATRELTRPLPKPARASRASRAQPEPSTIDALQGLDMRLTYRTLRVLSAIAAQPGASNREVADAAGVQDQGQISKLLARLERLGLLHNTGDGQPRGESNAWALTNKGKQIAGAVEPGQL